MRFVTLLCCKCPTTRAVSHQPSLGDLQRFARAVNCGTFSVAYFATTVAGTVEGQELGTRCRNLVRRPPPVDVSWARLCRSNVLRWMHIGHGVSVKCAEQHVRVRHFLPCCTQPAPENCSFTASCLSLQECATQWLHGTNPGRLTGVLRLCRCLQTAVSTRQRSWLATPRPPVIIRTTEPE